MSSPERLWPQIWPKYPLLFHVLCLSEVGGETNIISAIIFLKYLGPAIFCQWWGDGSCPLATKPSHCPWSWTCCLHNSYIPSSIQGSSFGSLPNCFSGEQDHTEQSQEDPGTHMTLLEAVLLNSCCRSVPSENDPCFWWFLQINLLNLAFSQEEVIGPEKKRKVSEPEKLLLNSRKLCSFWHTIHLEGVSLHCHLTATDHCLTLPHPMCISVCLFVSWKLWIAKRQQHQNYHITVNQLHLFDVLKLRIYHSTWMVSVCFFLPLSLTPLPLTG